MAAAVRAAIGEVGRDPWAKWGITEASVHHYPRIAGEQSGANIKVILRAFKELFKLRRQIKHG